MLAGSVISCSDGTGQENSRNSGPFYLDRVVEVRLVTAEEDWEFMQANPLLEEYVKADMWFDDELIPDIAVRTKGNSSLMTTASSGSIRFSLKADLNFFNSARDLEGVKKLCFNNGFSDPTLMREFLSYEIFDQMDIATPRASFVDLWMNDTHLGLYTMVEAIDKTFITDNFVDNSGNLYKPEMPAAYLNWTEEDYEKQVAGQEGQPDEYDVNLGGGNLNEILQALEPREYDDDTISSSPFPNIPRGQRGNLIEQMGLKTNENKPDHSLLFRFLDIINNEPDETFPEEIERVLDVDETLRYLAVSALIVHLDNYIAMGHNYYIYDNRGKFVVLPWDLNMAFGTFNFGLNREQLVHYYIDEPTGGPMDERPLVERLLSHQPYLDTYHGYLEGLLDGPFSQEVMKNRIDEIADLIRPYVEADTLKFSSTEDFEQGLYQDVGRAPQAGAPPYGLQMPEMPRFSMETMRCLQKYLPRERFMQIIRRGPDDKDLEILEKCLSDEELEIVLEQIEAIPSVPRMNFSPPAIGLVPFVIERAISVGEQLAGMRKCGPGDGSGNGGSFGMPGRPGQFQRGNRPPDV